jgi:hypothetical protein
MEFNESREAISWVRVSDPKQIQYSPALQTAENEKEAERNGYHVTKTIAVTYSCLALGTCKEFFELIAEIQTGKYGALIVYHHDRITAENWEYAYLMHFVRDARMRRFAVLPPQFDDSPENADRNEIIEHMFQNGKKQDTKSKRDRIKNSIHDNMKHGIPSSYREIWGWTPERKLGAKGKMVGTGVWKPNENWENRRHVVVDLAWSQGLSLGDISDTCFKEGILTPKHKARWTETGVENIILDPVNCGRYATNKTYNDRKTVNDLPKKNYRPESEWIWCDNIVIEKPLITEEQHELLKERYKVDHRKFATRNTTDIRRFRCMISSDDDRHWYPRKQKNSVQYVDPVTGHAIDEKPLAKAVGKTIRDIFSSTGNPFWRKIAKIEKNGRPQLDADLKRLTGEIDKIEDEIADLEARKKEIIKKYGVPVWDKTIKKVEDRYTNVNKSIADIRSQIAQSNSTKQKAASFLAVRDQFRDVIKGNEDNARWYALLKTLGCEIMMYTPEQYKFHQKMAVKSIRYLVETGESVQGKANWLALDSPKDWQYRDTESRDEYNNPTNDSFVTTLDIKRRKDAYPFKVVLILKGGLAVQPEQIARIISDKPESKLNIDSSVVKYATSLVPIIMFGSSSKRKQLANVTT